MSFPVLLLLVGSAEGQASNELIFLLAVFGCILLHELGHALAARKFGIQTRDIVLYPFGGIASLQSQPRPNAELWIALAGPAVNVALAIILFQFAHLPVSVAGLEKLDLATQLFLTNIGLAAFNMLPALPMDGGRVLRALLAIGGLRKATAIASRISQGICIVMGLLSVYAGMPMLLLVSFLIFFASVQEYVRSESKQAVLGCSVRDAMIPIERLEVMQHGMTISQAAERALTSPQSVYPVMLGTELLGVVSREDLLRQATVDDDDYVASVMHRSLPSIPADAPLGDAVEAIERTGSPMLIVTAEEKCAGLIVQDRLMEFVVVTGLRRSRSNHDDVEWMTPS